MDRDTNKGQAMGNVIKNFLAGVSLLGVAGDRRNYIPLSVTPSQATKKSLRRSWNTVSKGLASTARRQLNEAKETRRQG